MQNPDEITISWNVQDIYNVCATLSVRQARHVLAYLLETHDAAYGICWDTVEDAIRDIYPVMLAEFQDLSEDEQQILIEGKKV